MRKCSADRWEYHFMKYAINFPNCQYIDINGLILSWQHKSQPIYISSVTSTSRIATPAKQLFCDRNLRDRCFAMFCEKMFTDVQEEMQSPSIQTNIFRSLALLTIFLLHTHGRHGISSLSHFTWKYFSSFTFHLKILILFHVFSGK